MTRMLILSNRLLIEKNPLEEKADIYGWHKFPNIPRLSDYEIAVLDMKIPAGKYDGAFLGQRKEAQILLGAGGVLICLNYFTMRTNRRVYWSSKSQHPAVIRVLGQNQRWEINYDWVFASYLLSSLNVAQLDAKTGKNIALESKDKLFADYFKGVVEYHKTVDNIYPETDEEGNFLGYKLYIIGYARHKHPDTRVIATAKVTNKPIACVVGVSKGSLIFLPQSEAKPEAIISQLYALGNSEYGKNIETIQEYPSPPEWLDKHKTEQELDSEQKIEDLTNELEQKRLEHRRFEKIDVLLYGTGTPLEVAVQKALEEMGCAVEKMEKGATIDLKAKINSMKLAIEITGVDDKIYKNSRKFGQILEYLPMQEEDEKIVLLANTHKDIDVEERIGRENFTKSVKRIAENNDFCLMTTMNLYLIWKDFLDGKSPKEILEGIYSAKGEFRYAK